MEATTTDLQRLDQELVDLLRDVESRVRGAGKTGFENALEGVIEAGLEGYLPLDSPQWEGIDRLATSIDESHYPEHVRHADDSPNMIAKRLLVPTAALAADTAFVIGQVDGGEDLTVHQLDKLRTSHARIGELIDQLEQAAKAGA